MSFCPSVTFALKTSNSDISPGTVNWQRIFYFLGDCWQYIVWGRSGGSSTHTTNVCSPSGFLFYRIFISDSFSSLTCIPSLSPDSGNAQTSYLTGYFLCGSPQLLYFVPKNLGTSGVREGCVVPSVYFCTWSFPAFVSYKHSVYIISLLSLQLLHYSFSFLDPILLP